MKYFHVYYKIYNHLGVYIDYGIHSTMASGFPKFDELHDQLKLLNPIYNISIDNIVEVADDVYYVNLSKEAAIYSREKYINYILGNEDDEFKIDEDSEGYNLNLEQFNEISIIDDNVSYDSILIKFIKTLLKSYIESSHVNPPVHFFESKGIFDEEIDKDTYDDILMSYKYEIVKLIDEFNDYPKYSDDYNRIHINLIRFSQLLNGLW